MIRIRPSCNNQRVVQRFQLCCGIRFGNVRVKVDIILPNTDVNPYKSDCGDITSNLSSLHHVRSLLASQRFWRRTLPSDTRIHPDADLYGQVVPRQPVGNRLSNDVNSRSEARGQGARTRALLQAPAAFPVAILHAVQAVRSTTSAPQNLLSRFGRRWVPSTNFNTHGYGGRATAARLPRARG